MSRQVVDPDWILQAWQQFQHYGAPQGVREVVAESWIRCRSTPLEPTDSPGLCDPHRLAELQRAHAERVRAAHPFLERVVWERRGDPMAAALAGPEGVLLDVVSTKAFNQRLAGAALRVGADFGEAQAGTNCVTLALRTNRPDFVIGAEHYLRSFHEVAGLGIPLRTEGQQKPVAVLSVWVPIEHAATLHNAFFHLSTAAYAIERQWELLHSHAYSLTAATAHELRNPLTSLRALAQLGQMQTTDEHLRKLLGRIVDQADHMARIIHNLSLLERPSTEAHFEWLPLWEVVSRAPEMIRQTNPSAAAPYIDPAIERLPLVRANASLLAQALVNLLQNAVEAGEPVRVVGRYDKGADVVELVVTDSGPGIPPQVLSDIFKPYFTTKAEGTGLGLAITKNIVEKLHHGRIYIESRVGEGTRVFVQLPVTPHPLDAPTSPEA